MSTLRLVHPPATEAARGEEFRYWAFVSYSHRDLRAAAALQRALETYRLPRRLVGRATAIGSVPQAIKPVFRDRDELPAGTDLKTTVRAALAASRWLIVVCSPASAQSPWVNREIVEFKQHHGEARVLAVIVGGEPFASRLPGRAAEECFPEALRFALDENGEPRGAEHEPIAVDLRSQGDPKRLALLKLVAGMTGVGVDELARRDAQRRARRLARVALGASAGMLVMAVLTVMAVQARNEAQRQRAQAEDLIEFMLGDLRKKLEPVGRLDVLDAVGEKALAHYAAQRADELDANELGRRARALHLIGEIREKRGNLDEALKAFQSAADTTEKQLARAPNDGQRIFDHAQSVYWVGYAAWRRGRVGEAEQAFQQYRELAERLNAIDAARPEWQVEMAYAANNLGVVQVETGRADAALKQFERSRDVYLKLIRAQPELRHELAETYGWMAEAYEQQGDYASAVQSQLDKRSLFEHMFADGLNRTAQRLMANADLRLARLELLRGRLNEALAYARSAVGIGATLVALDSSNAQWRNEFAINRIELAQILLASRKADESGALVDAMRDDVRQLLARSVESLDWQIRLRADWLALRARLATAQSAPAPIDELTVFLQAVGSPDNTAQRFNRHVLHVAAAEFELAFHLRRAGDTGAAAAHWNAVVNRLQRLGDGVGLAGSALTAFSYLALNRHAEAQALFERLKDSQYRHPDLADVPQRLAHAAGATLEQSNKRR